MEVLFLFAQDDSVGGVVYHPSNRERLYAVGVSKLGWVCQTNNNQICPAHKGTCQHIRALVQVAYERLVPKHWQPGLSMDAFLEVIHAQPRADILPPEHIFAQAARYMTFSDRGVMFTPIPEMDWFPSPKTA